MEKCNPRDAPITEDLIKAMHNNKGKPLPAMDAKLVKGDLGKFSWLADTVHGLLIMRQTHSILAGYSDKPVERMMECLDQVWRWLQNAKEYCLVVGHRKGAGYHF